MKLIKIYKLNPIVFGKKILKINDYYDYYI